MNDNICELFESAHPDGMRKIGLAIDSRLDSLVKDLAGALEAVAPYVMGLQQVHLQRHLILLRQERATRMGVTRLRSQIDIERFRRSLVAFNIELEWITKVFNEFLPKVPSFAVAVSKASASLRDLQPHLQAYQWTRCLIATVADLDKVLGPCGLLAKNLWSQSVIGVVRFGVLQLASPDIQPAAVKLHLPGIKLNLTGGIVKEQLTRHEVDKRVRQQ